MSSSLCTCITSEESSVSLEGAWNTVQIGAMSVKMCTQCNEAFFKEIYIYIFRNIYSYIYIYIFRMDWFHLLAVQGTLKTLQPHSSEASILWCSAFFMVNACNSFVEIKKTDTRESK